jgi:thiol-disulfide isomerase/thioredoxin
MPRLAVLALLLLAAPARAADRPNLDGTWLFDECVTGKHSDLGRFWESVVTVRGERFTLTRLMWNPKPLTGRLVFDPADADAVDLVLDELDFAAMKLGVRVPGGTYRGKFDAKADRFTLAIARDPGGKRPEKLEASEAAFFAALTRAPAGFKDFPKEVTFRVFTPDGKPAAGAKLGSVLHKRTDVKGEKPEWKVYNAVTTGDDGTAKTPHAMTPSIARDEAARTVAFITLSPAKLAAGEVRVTLAPEVRVTGKVVSDELAKAGGKVGWTEAAVAPPGRVGVSFVSENGEFELLVPPGTFRLAVSGVDMAGKGMPLEVPPFRSELALDPIDLRASDFTRLRGKPAPELADVMGWAGTPLKLADLKGQYVLLEFWGFWCGPCIKQMPTLVALHEKFAGKGLAVVGVHMDLNGDVDTAAKYDEKMAHVVKTVWGGKGLPFPNALVSGKRDDTNRPGGTPNRYAVTGFPTTVLIDRDGKVVGKFQARDTADAVAQIEALLKK